jgi:hypothetical protein
LQGPELEFEDLAPTALRTDPYLLDPYSLNSDRGSSHAIPYFSDTIASATKLACICVCESPILWSTLDALLVSFGLQSASTTGLLYTTVSVEFVTYSLPSSCFHIPFFPWFASSFFCCGMRYVVSHPYNAPAPNTMAAPTFINPPISLPKIQMLNKKLTNLRMFKTIVTVTADVLALRILTPVIQSSCVTAFAVR